MPFESAACPALASRSLDMRIAFWTAFDFVRPFHALQQWWCDPRGFTTSAKKALSTNINAAPFFTASGADISANHGKMTDRAAVERSRPATIFHRSLALAPTRFSSPCSLVIPPASQKSYRAGVHATTTRRHGGQKPMRMVKGSASTQEAGHFFIAGRMADVCAELERLAEYEATH